MSHCWKLRADSVEEGLQRPEHGGQDQGQDRKTGGSGEGLVGDGVEGERGSSLVLGGDREQQGEQREGDDAHGVGDGFAVHAFGPGDHAEGAGADDDAGGDEPDQEPPGEDRRVGRAGLALHQPLGRLTVAEADRLEQQGGEVDPQRLQREERHPAEDVEDAGAEERDDEPEQASHLEADVAGQVVVEAAAELDGLDDRGEVVVGEDHHRGFLGHLGAGDAHGDADVGLLQRGRVVDAVAGHRDDVALALAAGPPAEPCPEG